MSLTAIDVAAIVGAGAWLPQVVGWIHRAATKPTLTVVPDKTASIGFTAYGPIFNLQLALAVDRKDIIVTRLGFKLIHDTGEQREFSWRGMTETFSAIRDNSGIEQGRFEKDQTAIALKVTTGGLVEKFFRFQEDKFWHHVEPILKAAVQHKKFLESQKPNYHDEFLRSKEHHLLVNAHKEFFGWRAGTYKVLFSIDSSHRPRVRPPRFEFELSQADVDALRTNLDLIGPNYEQQVRAGVPGNDSTTISFVWRNPNLRTPVS